MILKTFKKFLVESSLSRMLHHWESDKSGIGIISAFRGENTPVENEKLSDQLERDIRNENHGFVRAIGKYIETRKGSKEKVPVFEKTFIIAASNTNLKANLLIWMRKYFQESVIYKPIGSKKTFSLREDGTTELLGSFGMNRVKDYMTFLAKNISTARNAEADVRSFYLEAMEIPKNIAALLAEAMREKLKAQKLSKK